MDSEIRRAVRYILATENLDSVCSIEEAQQLQKIIKDFIRKESQKTSIYWCTTFVGSDAPTSGISCQFLGYVHQFCRNKGRLRLREWLQRQDFTFYQIIDGMLKQITIENNEPLPDNEQDYIAVHKAVFSYPTENAERRILESYKIGLERRNKIIRTTQKAAETRKRKTMNNQLPVSDVPIQTQG